MQEHPFLHRPFLMLHPCQAQAVMQLLTETPETGAGAAAAKAAAEQGTGSAAAAPGVAAPGGASPGAAAPGVAGTAADRTLRYLLAWLSVAGQPLGLGLPATLWRQALA